MARPNYSHERRQRAQEKDRRREEKAERRRQNRASGGSGIQITSAEEIQGGIMRGLEDEPSGRPAPRSNTIPSRLFVGGLSQEMTSADLRTLFETYGPVDDAIVVTDRDLGESRGFGFVTMADRRDATAVIEQLSGREVDGRVLVVKPATERGR